MFQLHLKNIQNSETKIVKKIVKKKIKKIVKNSEEKVLKTDHHMRISGPELGKVVRTIRRSGFERVSGESKPLSETRTAPPNVLLNIFNI